MEFDVFTVVEAGAIRLDWFAVDGSCWLFCWLGGSLAVVATDPVGSLVFPFVFPRNELIRSIDICSAWISDVDE